ncbi:hypothetical protein D3C80_2075500 [compost metagenome]
MTCRAEKSLLRTSSKNSEFYKEDKTVQKNIKKNDGVNKKERKASEITPDQNSTKEKKESQEEETN